MSEDTKVGGEEQVNEGVPTPKFTETSRDSATSALDPKELARQVAEILRPDIEKTVQSTKDKRIASLEKAVSNLAELENLGVVIPPDVKLEMRLREIESQKSAPQANSQGSGKVEAGEWSRIVEEIGLDTKSSEYVEFLRQEFKNLDQFEAQANRLKRKMDSKPNPSTETSPTLDGHKGNAVDDSQLIARLKQLQINPSKNLKEMKEIEEKLGWN